MDRDAFDKLTKVLAASPNRRAALGAMLGAGLTGVVTSGNAARKARRNKRKGGKGSTASLGAEAADCANPGPSSNMNGCNFAGDDFAGQDLSGSSMVNTIFVGADLDHANLSSSTMRAANFRGADLRCADLSSSTLRNANFRDADLTFADLSSSACAGITFTPGTTFCRTRDCTGKLRNDDCPGGPPGDLCCPACDDGEACVDNECVAVCDQPYEHMGGACAATLVGRDPVCIDPIASCFAPGCTSDAGCGSGQACVATPCCGGSPGRCLFTGAGDCACPVLPASCTDAELVKCKNPV